MIEKLALGLEATLRRDKLFLVLCCIVGAVGMIAYAFFMKPKYESSMTLVLPLEDSASLGLSIATGQGPSPLDVLKSIVLSEESKEKLARQEGLTPREVDKMLSVETDVSANNISIKGEGTTPNAALAFVNSAYQILAQTSSELALSRSAEQAKNYKKVLNEIKGEMPSKEQEALHYESGMKTAPNPDEKLIGQEYVAEAKQLSISLAALDQKIAIARNATATTASQGLELPTGIPGIEPLRDGLLQLRYQLAVAETTEGPESPDVLNLKQEIALAETYIKAEISKFERSVKGNANKDIADLLAQRTLLAYEKDQADRLAKLAPREGLELKNKINEADVAANVYSGLREQYEISRVGAETDKVRWSVLDPPHLDDFGEPINKHYPRTGLGGAALGLIVGLGIGAIRRKDDEPVPSDRED